MNLFHDKKTRVGIADNQELFRKKVIGLINEETHFEVVLEAVNGIDLLEKITRTTPDVVLMDIKMPKMDGIKATEALQREYPDVKVIVYAQYVNQENVIAVYSLGGKGLLRKSDDLSELSKAIQIVANGGVYLTEKACEVVQNGLKRLGGFQSNAGQIQLSMMERKLLAHVCSGLSCTEIGAMMCKSPRTIEKYRADLYLKFGVNSKVRLVKRCLESGII